MKSDFENLLKGLLDDINQIDRETPWQEIEPAWWLEMMRLEGHVRSSIEYLKNH